MATPLIITAALVIFSLFTISYSLPSETLTNAGETLSNSGYVAMSLTLSLLPQTLLSQPTSATIFTPPDTVFSNAGQPSLSLLQFHFSPLAFTEDSLRSLPFGTKIPTLSSTNSLTITTNSSTSPISLNNVTITGSPIFDDGLLIVYGITEFFDFNFTIPVNTENHKFDMSCIVASNKRLESSFDEASGVLKSRGYSVMAYFLDLQLLGLIERRNLTVFAPPDDALVDYIGHIPDYPSLFLRHVVPCKVTWTDLLSIGNGTMVTTYLDRFRINVTKSDSIIMVNNVSVTFPDLYYSDWLVVHGLRKSFMLAETVELERDQGEVTETDYSEEALLAPALSPL